MAHAEGSGGGRSCTLTAHIQHARRRRISPDGLRMRMEPASRLVENAPQQDSAMLCEPWPADRQLQPVGDRYKSFA